MPLSDLETKDFFREEVFVYDSMYEDYFSTDEADLKIDVETNYLHKYSFGLSFSKQTDAVVLILRFIGYRISMVASPVFNIILILLAVQRFSLYFYEDSEKFLNLKSFFMSLLVVFLYLFFAILHLVIRIEESLIAKNAFMYFLASFAVYISLILELLACFSVLVYIPMFISIRKLLHLPSLAQSQPQTYMMYQVKFIFIGKLFMLILLVGSGIVSKFSGWTFSMLAFVITNLSTFYMTPLIIQMTYLFCNKRNTQLVISYLSFRFVIDKLRRLLRKNNAVQPIVPTDGRV
ncbi:hypothetical protein CRE_14536 [Caenorhabditis remanei]|uniref:Uncharacterized protein n=1 Tax=Caenorhabditis remanei TaxID=31234 RepID=E3M9E7_CAERE|nr:hypothetical protein CRE_14536 [Caenorhabditis remanei]